MLNKTNVIRLGKEGLTIAKNAVVNRRPSIDDKTRKTVINSRVNGSKARNKENDPKSLVKKLTKKLEKPLENNIFNLQMSAHTSYSAHPKGFYQQ